MALSLLRGGPALWAGQQILKHAHRRWKDLPEDDRRELTRLVRKSKGRRENLTPAERDEVGRIVRRYIGRER